MEKLMIVLLKSFSDQMNGFMNGLKTIPRFFTCFFSKTMFDLWSDIILSVQMSTE